VLRRLLCLALFALPFAAAGCGGGADAGEPGASGSEIGLTRQISGRWTGTLHQDGLRPFRIAVDLGADSAAEVAYTGIQCGGGWKLDGVETSVPPRYLFTEQISEGAGDACKGTGTVSLSPIQSQAPNEPAYNRLDYRFTGGGVTSSGLLHRTDTPHLRAVFKKGGVGGP